jgi:uncharacterized protein YecE (DUF72 family)
MAGKPLWRQVFDAVDRRVAGPVEAGARSDAFADTLALLNGFGSAWVQIDEPKFKFSIRQNYLPNVQGFYYMRLHGRNADKWWRHEKSEERYDYLYSAAELKEFAETADAARRLVKKLYLYTNNHFSAKSVANAVMIKEQLGEPIDGEYPPEFIERFPGLTNVVAVAPPSELFDAAMMAKHTKPRNARKRSNVS